MGRREEQHLPFKEKAGKLKVWEVVEKAFDDGSLVNGTIVARVNGGLAVDIGVKAFLPNSQVVQTYKEC